MLLSHEPANPIGSILFIDNRVIAEPFVPPDIRSQHRNRSPSPGLDFIMSMPAKSSSLNEMLERVKAFWIDLAGGFLEKPQPPEDFGPHPVDISPVRSSLASASSGDFPAALHGVALTP